MHVEIEYSATVGDRERRLSRLLTCFPKRRFLNRRIFRFDVAPGLQPPPELPVTDQRHPPSVGHHGASGEVSRGLRPGERLREQRTLGTHQGEVGPLFVVGRHHRSEQRVESFHRPPMVPRFEPLRMGRFRPTNPLPSMPALLEARGLRKAYQGRVLLDGVDLRLERGAITTVGGPSGAGKTTLLRILGQLSEPDSGQVLLDGADVQTLVPHVTRRRIALVAQAPAMFPGAVLENVRTGPRLAGRDVPESTARELIMRAGLDAEFLGQDARALSGGEKFRVAVARAMALHPEVWLLDEPTAALDDERADVLVRLLRELAGEGAPILVVTHDARALEQLGGRHLELVSGRLGDEVAAKAPA